MKLLRNWKYHWPACLYTPEISQTSPKNDGWEDDHNRFLLGPGLFSGAFAVKIPGVGGMVGLFLEDPRFPSQSRQGIQDFHKDCSQEWRVKQRFFPAQASAVLHVCCGVAVVDLKHVKDAVFA